MNQKLFFIHIPKTAGTSVRFALESRFDPAKVMPVEGYNEKDTGPRALRRYDLIAAHLGADHFNFIGEGYRSFTVLREPRARLVSLYNMHRVISPERLSQLSGPQRVVWQTALDSSLAEFLRSDQPEIALLVRDAQVRQLASSIDDASDRSRDLELARENLSRIDVVGVTELLGSTLALLMTRMGWTEPFTLAHHARVSPTVSLDSLDDETRSELDRVTRLDQQLYRAALSRLDKDLASIRTTDSASEPVHGNASTARPERVLIPMDGPSPGEGWHVREGPPETPTRWTGPGTQTTVAVRLAPGTDYLLDLRLRGYMAQDIFDGLRIVSGDRVCRHWTRNEVPGENIIEAKIPGDSLDASGLAKLILSTPRTMSHQQLIPGNPDDRPKGLAVASLTLTPVSP